MFRLVAVLCALCVVSACATPGQVVSVSKGFCADMIGYDLAPGSPERLAGLGCVHQETMFRRAGQGAAVSDALRLAIDAKSVISPARVVHTFE